MESSKYSQSWLLWYIDSLYNSGAHNHIFFGSLINSINFSLASQHLPPQNQHVTKALNTRKKRAGDRCKGIVFVKFKSATTIKLDDV